MADTKKRDQYVNVSPLDKKTQKSIHKYQLDQKKAEEKEHNSRATQKKIKETYERLADQENRRRDDINKIIKEQGYYNGPNGEHYEKKLKKVSVKDIAAEHKTQIVRPTKVKKMGLFNRLAIAIARGIAGIKNFFANLFTKRTIADQAEDRIVTNGNPMAGIKINNKSADEKIAEFNRDAMQVAKDLYQPEPEKNDIVDAKKEFQFWMNRNKINDKAPREIVFDFMKAATLQNMITNEKGISDILTYSLENKCEYHAETGDTLMYFQLKDGGIGVIGVNDRGEILHQKMLL